MNFDKVTSDGWASIRFTEDESMASGYVRQGFLQSKRLTVDFIKSKAMDPAAPLDIRLTWLQRWLAIWPDNKDALLALRDAHTLSGNTRDAEVVDSRLRGDFPVHLGVCAMRDPFVGGYSSVFDSTPKKGSFILLASVTSQGITSQVDAIAFSGSKVTKP